MVLWSRGGAAAARVRKNQGVELRSLRLTWRGALLPARLLVSLQVPVACFGEADLFHMYIPPPGSLGAKFQAVSHKVLPGRQPLFWGDGVFADPGLLPLARPLTTVVGAPIPVAKWQGAREGPEWEAAVDGLHARYCAELRALWDAWRDKVEPGRPRAPLTVVG
ncbi:2-acylglycerol O-acyltransferase 2-B [Monoraphidium neglectum]|uniref:diacylglycerol O-acyltransferase n=1 Tax=Monoraphidium neglectum TaxID=145388 RepID=A0A0D2L7W3_9CHLO|nr:2-acylglycerol O-acyltransferase 2-B [Monoraphidium neglectum]KIZ02949.1 2-acylglycerol O-acyltransferase 2-B [Monoraphidium neglectum]|eukprot:XP_013901968.1 2-acylglycerol O-acyltransferase 2-B [Monoraphidium neglectum]